MPLASFVIAADFGGVQARVKKPRSRLKNSRLQKKPLSLSEFLANIESDGVRDSSPLIYLIG